MVGRSTALAQGCLERTSEEENGRDQEENRRDQEENGSGNGRAEGDPGTGGSVAKDMVDSYVK